MGYHWFVVVDGEEGKQFHHNRTRGIIFSPDSKRVAYCVSGGGKWSVVVDGKKEGKQYDEIRGVTFSPDSRRVAYRVIEEKGSVDILHKFFVVVDGEEGKQYDEIGEVTFSQSLIREYGLSATPWRIVRNEYGKIMGVTFSPDSKRVAYGAKVGKKACVVVDGKEEEKQYDEIMGVAFSPDSKRVAYGAKVEVERKWLVSVTTKQFVVVDGEEGKQYDSIISVEGGEIIFDSPDSLYYHATDGNNIYLVGERIN